MATYPSVLAGQDITADLLNSMLPQIAVKSVGEAVTSSIAQQNDNELFVPAVANATYFVELWLLHDSAVAGDISIGWAALSGATFSWGVVGPHIGATTSSTVTDVNMQTRALNEAADLGGGGSTGTTAIAKGIFTTASTSGNIQLTWAQRVSSVTATNVRAGSFLSARRIA